MMLRTPRRRPRDRTPHVLGSALYGYQFPMVTAPDPSVFAVKDESWAALRDAIERSCPEGTTPQAFFAERLSAIGRRPRLANPPNTAP